MKTRQKDLDVFIRENTFLKHGIKASQSEIMKDFLLINNSVPVFSKIPLLETDPRKLQKVKEKQRGRKHKQKITEDISPVLGFASLLNEISSFSKETIKKPKHSKLLKKASKTSKNSEFPKLEGFTRAETHLGIARFIIAKDQR